MEQRLAALFASVGNALDSNTYTYSDSDYLVRKILVKFLEDENSLVASARRIPDPEQVVESILNYVISTEFANEDPASWYRKAMAITVEFADFAHRNDMSKNSARYAALLPDGHPRVKRVLPVTASAARESLAEWMAADPRLDAEAAEQVRKLYSLDDSTDDVEAEFETLKAEALVAAGRMPEELLPIVAAFNLSFAQRSAISKALAAVRRRDRKGRFAEEFGRLKLFFKSRGEFFSSSPRIVGPGRGENTFQVESKGDPNIPDGIYEVDAALGENVKAYLPKSAVKGLAKRKEVVAEDDKRFAIELDDFLKTKQDVPNNWTKSGNKFTTKDGKFTATKIDSNKAQDFLNKAQERGDDTIISGTGAADAFDPENPESFLVTDNKGRTKGVAQDWSGIQEIAIANGAEFGDKGVPEPTDISGLRRPPRFPGDTEGFQPYDGTDIGARDRNNGRRNKKLQLESDLGRKLTPEEIEAFDLEPESESVVNRSSSRAYGDFLLPQKEQDRRQKIRDAVQDEIEKGSKVDLDQDSTAPLDKSKLSPSLIGEGYNFSKDGDNSWRKDGHGPDGETYTVEQGSNGKWIVGEITGSDPFAESRDLEVFDNALEAFEYANDLGRRPSDFDDDWVNDLIAEQEAGPDLGQDQPEVDSRTRIDASKLSPELQEKYQETFDKFDQAIFNNDRLGIADMLSKAALDNDMPDEVYSVLSEARDWVANRDAVIENALSRASREDLENLLEDPEFAGWRDRLESAMIELAPFGQDGYDYDLDQDTAPALSEKQAEPATGKQYAMLSEFLEERNLDPATEQALADAIENKNLNKAQASALIGLSRAADFKEGVDPSKPSERMLNSLQGYLSTKDLTPSEINDTLKSLEADSSRDNVEALLNKLRRKKDKPADLNQGTGSLVKVDDDVYSWNDAYNYVDAMKTPNGWEVFYSNPDLNDRGGQTSHSQAFKSEEEALAFAEELVKQNQEGKDYDRAADDLAAGVDLDQDQETKPSLADAATDKQYGFLESLLNGKKIDDPNLEAAVRTAVQDKNLTKGEVGAFIGALRNLPDRPNVRREPTAKQVASIKRGIIERDFTPEQIKEIEDRLSSGISFEEASEIIDDIKKRPVTAQGMNDLLDSLAKNQDVDTLRYLLDKPEYNEFRDSIKDTLRQIAVDTEDPNLQEFIDGSEEPDLNQSSFRRFNTEWNLDLDVISPEDREKYRKEISEVNLAQNIGHAPTVRALREKYSEDSSLPENLKAEILSSLDTWLEYDAEVSEALESIWDEDENSESSFRKIELMLQDSTFKPWWPLLGDDSGRTNIVGNEDEYNQVMDELGLDLSEASPFDSGVDLDQNQENLDWINFGPGYIEDGTYTSPDGRIEVSAERDRDYQGTDDEPKLVSVKVDGVEVDNFRVSQDENTDVRETIRESIKEAQGGPDLDQDQSVVDYLDNMSDPANWNNWSSFPEYTSPDGRLSIRAEGDPEGNYLEIDLDGEPLNLDRDAERAILDAIEQNNIEAGFRGRPVPERERRNTAQLIADTIRESLVESQDTLDLDQDQSARSIQTKDIADQISKELDAIDFYMENAAAEAYDRFINSKSAPEAGAWIQDIRDYASERDVPSELATKMENLADRMEQELIDKFGVAEAARHSNDSSRDVMYLDDVAQTIETEREIFFETSADRIAELLDDRGFYGDIKSGGVEVYLNEEDDGTYTATVRYDRGSEEFKGKDRDEVIADAADAAADYNSNVIPRSYRDGDLDDLVEEAENAKSPEDAIDFADRIDAIARDLENHRGDPEMAQYLREYGERMREMAEKRQAFLESQLPNEPTTPETQEEMAADPDLNPAGYAKSVADDFAEQFLESEEFDGPTSGDGRPGPGTFTSKDGRIRVIVNSDGDLDGDRMVDTSNYDVFIDGEAVTPSSGIALKLSDVMADEIQGLVEDFFSKKD